MFLRIAIWLLHCCCFLKILFKLDINTKLPVVSSCDPDPSLCVTTTASLEGKIPARPLGWLQTPASARVTPETGD